MSTVEQLELLQKLRTMMPTEPARYISADSAAQSTARIYSSNARLAEALATD